MWCILSVWLLPYILMHAVAERVGASWFPSPFPLALAATSFTAVYSPLVLGMHCVESAINVAIHAAAVFLCKPDVSMYSIACSVVVVMLYWTCTWLSGTDPFVVYFVYLPKLSKEHPGLFNRKKWRCICRTCGGGERKWDE